MNPLLLLPALFALTSAANPPYGQLSVSGTKLKGSSGQDVALHGMSLFWSNFGEGAPFYNAETVRALKCYWNSNIVRAAMGVEGGYLNNPSQEQAKLEAVVQAAVAEGIYVIIDWHDHNAQSHQSQAVSFFTAMAQKYGKNTNILYEIFNEPLQVDWNSVVKPYAQAVIKAIRAVDPNNVIIVGTPTWSQDVDVAANSPITGYKNIMYTLHYYAATHKQDLRNKLTAAVNKGLPVFVTEYGTVTADGNGYVDSAESQTWWNFLDGLKISYVNWAVDNKNEKSAALNPGSTSANVGNSNYWTESGKLVQAKLASQSNGISGCPATTRPPATTTAKPNPNGVSASLNVGSTWDGGREYKIALKNSGSGDRCNVVVNLNLNGGSIDNMWNLSPVSGSQYRVSIRVVRGTTNTDAGIAYRGSATPSVSVVTASGC